MRSLLVLIFLIGGFLILLFLFKTRVGDIRPAVLPPIKPTELSQPKTGEPVAFPLAIANGFTIGIFAKDLGKPRDLAFSEGGTLLASIPSAGKIVALPDKDADGLADEVKTILANLNNPHGITFSKGKLYVVEETKVVRYLWNENTLSATKEKELFTLPRGGNHRTRTIVFDKKGQMFISLGSTCDVCFEKHEWLAAVIVSDEEGSTSKLWAKGLRNSVFITINPQTDELWGTEMGRDFLGDNLPPDEVNIIRDGKDYGWPRCYGNKIHDTSFNRGSKVSPCEATEGPVFEIAAHSAPLGLTFIDSPRFPKEWQGDLLVAYHGSWNRSTPIGYKVVRLDVDGNSVKGEQDFVTGFLPESQAPIQSGQALGRPVDLVFDREGSLYISDDKTGVIYKVIGK